MGQANVHQGDGNQDGMAEVSREAMEAGAKTSESVARTSRETARQTARLARDTAEQAIRVEHAGAEQASRIGREAAELGEQTARAGADALARTAETLNRTWQSGLSIATQLSEQSFDQFARMFGLAGERSKQAAQHSSRHVAAIMDSSSVITGGLETLSCEWIDFVQQRVARQRDRFEQVLTARTPHDFTAMQAEVMRDNVESFLLSFSRIADLSARLTEDAASRMTDTAGREAKST
jgi:hypothetical protein